MISNRECLTFVKVFNNGTYISVLIDMISAIKRNRIEKMFDAFNRFMELTEEKELRVFTYDDERRRQLIAIRKQLIELRSKLEEAKVNKTKVVVGKTYLEILLTDVFSFFNILMFAVGGLMIAAQ